MNAERGYELMIQDQFVNECLTTKLKNLVKV